MRLGMFKMMLPLSWLMLASSLEHITLGFVKNHFLCELTQYYPFCEYGMRRMKRPLVTEKLRTEKHPTNELLAHVSDID